ncbi:zinc finger protein 260-like [Cebidichthys violaceus]|uniref:zinc finger protein 260-like n=1 Tax=Cebidichthys violaceus TaxID=271503 RepID=UPI0035C976F8
MRRLQGTAFGKSHAPFTRPESSEAVQTSRCCQTESTLCRREGKMSKVQMLRALVEQRLIAAAEEIFGVFERTIAEYEEELCHSKEENERQRKLLDAVFNPQLRLHRADVQQLLVVKEEVPSEQQEWSSSLDQEDPEPPHIKEDQEELWTSQEGEQLQGLEEEFSFTPVKSEDDEEKPQSSQLHQRQTEQMETEADGEDFGGPEPDRNSDPDRHPEPETDDKTGDPSEPETDNSDEPQSGLNSLNNDKVSVSGSICSAGEKPFGCSECGKRFVNKKNVKNHMITHTGEKPFSCSECGKRFGARKNLKMHLRCHAGEKPFSCSVCNKSFVQRGYFKSHMRIHTGEKPFSCLVCDRRFTWSIQLKRHKRDHHHQSSQLHQTLTEENREAEPQSVLNSLNNDEVSVIDSRCSAGEKPFHCSECGKRFGAKKILKRHMIIHELGKRFICSFCKKTFAQRTNLQVHIRNHTGEKPFSCSLCDKAFIGRGHLKKHMESHPGEKPFCCSV